MDGFQRVLNIFISNTGKLILISNYLILNLAIILLSYFALTKNFSEDKNDSFIILLIVGGRNYY